MVALAFSLLFFAVTKKREISSIALPTSAYPFEQNPTPHGSHQGWCRTMDCPQFWANLATQEVLTPKASVSHDSTFSPVPQAEALPDTSALTTVAPLPQVESPAPQAEATTVDTSFVVDKVRKSVVEDNKPFLRMREKHLEAQIEILGRKERAIRGKTNLELQLQEFDEKVGSLPDSSKK
ncbi:MAG: hypothetical protein AAB873_01605 [Patescibacteria group bacterium]